MARRLRGEESGTMGSEGFVHNRIERIAQPQKVWGWEIAVDLYLAGMGAGAFSVGLVLDWYWNFSLFVKPFGRSIDLGRATLLWGPLLVVISTLFLVLDLGIKRRFLYACLNPKTSWVARGFLILSTFIVLGLIVLSVSTLLPHAALKASLLWPLLKGLSLLFAVLTTLYTGILLKSVRYVPLWNTFLIPILFLASSLLSGAAGIILTLVGCALALPSAQTLLSRAYEVVLVAWSLVVLEGLILVYHLRHVSEGTEEGMESVRLLLVGDRKRPFWGGTVFAGFMVPAFLQLAYFWYSSQLLLLILTCLFFLAGRFFLRWVLIASALKEKHPLERLLEVRSNLCLSKGRATN